MYSVCPCVFYCQNKTRCDCTDHLFTIAYLANKKKDDVLRQKLLLSDVHSQSPEPLPGWSGVRLILSGVRLIIRPNPQLEFLLPVFSGEDGVETVHTCQASKTRGSNRHNAALFSVWNTCANTDLLFKYLAVLFLQALANESLLFNIKHMNAITIINVYLLSWIYYHNEHMQPHQHDL